MAEEEDSCGAAVSRTFSCDASSLLRSRVGLGPGPPPMPVGGTAATRPGQPTLLLRRPALDALAARARLLKDEAVSPDCHCLTAW